MINKINTVDNTSGQGFPQWVDWIDGKIKNSVRVDSIVERQAILKQVFETKKLQEENRVKHKTRIVYRKR